MNKPRRSNKKGKDSEVDISFRIIKFTIEKVEFNFPDEIEQDEIMKNLAFTVLVKMDINNSISQIQARTNFILYYNNKEIHRFETVTAFEFLNIQKVYKKRGDEVELLKGVSEIILMTSVGNTRGAHALEIQQTKYPLLFIPFLIPEEIKRIATVIN